MFISQAIQMAATKWVDPQTFNRTSSIKKKKKRSPRRHQRLNYRYGKGKAVHDGGSPHDGDQAES